MNYQIQIDGTEPDKWQNIDADDPYNAILAAARPLILAGAKPETAYVALGKFRHPNGTPCAVQSYSLKIGPSQ